MKPALIQHTLFYYSPPPHLALYFINTDWEILCLYLADWTYNRHSYTWTTRNMVTRRLYSPASMRRSSISGSILGHSARAIVKKTQEPGIKLQKADFFRNDTWTSPQTNSEDAPKIPLVHFFNSRWPPPCNAIFEKQGYTLILHLCS